MTSLPEPLTSNQLSIDAQRILVVIPTLNEAAHIERTLTVLLGDAPVMSEVAIVVVDGGSSDGTQEIVDRLSTKWRNISRINNPAKVQAAGVNLAVKQCAKPGQDILIRVDAHSHYPAGYVLRVVENLEETGADSVVTVMDTVAENCFQRGLEAALSTPFGTGGSAHRGGTHSGYVDHGHHAGIRLHRFVELGGYDSGFATNEDAEFDHRLTQAGGRIWLEASIRLGYVVRKTPTELARQYWRYGKGRGQTILKHRMTPKARQMIPVLALCLNVTSILLAPFVPKLLWLPFGYFMCVGLLGVVLAVKSRVVCALWAGPALAIMHMFWGAGLVWQFLRRSERVA